MWGILRSLRRCGFAHRRTACPDQKDLPLTWSQCENSFLLSFRRVPMGLHLTRANENYPRRHPRESGGPFSAPNTMDSRLRGNDVIFGGAAGDEESSSGLENIQSEVPRFARNDSLDQVLTETLGQKVARDGAFARRARPVKGADASRWMYNRLRL